MKAKRLFPVLMFLAGLITGGSLLAIFAFASPNPPPQPISAQVAHSYHNNYLIHANPMNTVFKAFTIDRAQFEDMRTILDADKAQTLKGCRIYLGIDNNSTNIGIVVGIDDDNLDVVSGANAILTATARYLGPCPTVCDTHSPIY